MKTIIIALLIAFACSVEVVPAEEDTDLMFNPDGLLKCLEEASPVAADVRELIQLLKDKKYDQALTKTLQIWQTGSQLIKRCIGYIQLSVNLTINWLSLAKCISYAAGGAGIAVEVANAIAARNIGQLALLGPKVIAHLGGVPKNCKKFW